MNAVIWFEVLYNCILELVHFGEKLTWCVYFFPFLCQYQAESVSDQIGSWLCLWQNKLPTPLASSKYFDWISDC